MCESTLKSTKQPSVSEVDMACLVRPDGWKTGSFEDCRKQCPRARIVRRETKEGESPHRWQDWDCTHPEQSAGDPCDPSMCPIFIDPETDEDGNDELDRWSPAEFVGFFKPNHGADS